MNYYKNYSGLWESGLSYFGGYWNSTEGCAGAFELGVTKWDISYTGSIGGRLMFL